MIDNNILKIDKNIEDMFLTAQCYPNDLDYTIIEKKKDDWTKLSEISRSIVLVFDCYANKFVFVSNNIPESYGIDHSRLISDGHIPALERMHPDDIHYGLLMRRKIYSVLNGFSPKEKMQYKIVNEMRMKNIRDEYIRIIEQEQAIELDKQGNVWLMLSVIDIDASHDSEITKSHLYNVETGEQVFINLSDILEEPLTVRELEVLQMMKQGLLSKEIADTLKVSINTINSHRQNILHKLNANNSIEAVNFAKRLGLSNR